MRLVLSILIRACVATAFSAILVVTAGRGPKSKLWETCRLKSSIIASKIDSRAGPREIREREKVGRYSEELKEIEEHLRKKGFRRNPLSRVKTLDNHREDGSWVKRSSPFSRRQLHVMLFEKSSGTEVYAHEEYSSVNPFTVIRHYLGIDQYEQKGVKRATKIMNEL